jgi:hypothetical protein
MSDFQMRKPLGCLEIILSNVRIDRESLVPGRQRQTSADVAEQNDAEPPVRPSSFANDDGEAWPLIPFPDGWYAS